MPYTEIEVLAPCVTLAVAASASHIVESVAVIQALKIVLLVYVWLAGEAWAATALGLRV